MSTPALSAASGQRGVSVGHGVIGQLDLRGA